MIFEPPHIKVEIITQKKTYVVNKEKEDLDKHNHIAINIEKTNTGDSSGSVEITNLEKTFIKEIGALREVEKILIKVFIGDDLIGKGLCNSIQLFSRADIDYTSNFKFINNLQSQEKTKTYKKDTLLSDILQDFYPNVKIDDDIKSIKTKKSLSLYGGYYSVLNTLQKNFNLIRSNNKFSIKGAKYKKGNSKLWEYTPKNGLRDIPSIEDLSINFAIAFNPSIEILDYAKLDYEYYEVDFIDITKDRIIQITDITHEGNNKEGINTEIKGLL